MKNVLFLILALFWGVLGCATDRLQNGIGQEVLLDEALGGVLPGEVVVIGENHGLKTHQLQQLAIMDALRRRSVNLSVGMEFFEYPAQAWVEAYQTESLGEDDFLKKIQWGKIPFDFYRAQVRFPKWDQGERVIALNCPRTLTGKIAKEGLEVLTPEELKLLPTNFSLGRDSYRERFLEAMPHLPPGAGDRYFAAQSAWDDTMAWKAVEFTQAHPNQVLVIIVGEYHVQYGGGLPDRIRARGGKIGKIISLFNTEGLSEAEIQQATLVHEKWGERADLIWISNSSASVSSPFVGKRVIL